MSANNEIKNTVRASIKKLIKSKGLTIEEVATRMGITGPALSQTINGNPTIDMLERISTALEVEIRALFEDTGNDLYGLVQYKGSTYKVDSQESLKRLIALIEAE